MYPDLSYILHAILGTPVDNGASIFKTFGLFLVLAILGASWLLYKELKRKSKEGIFQAEKVKTVYGKAASLNELLSNGVFGFILGFKVLYAYQHFAEFKGDAAGVILSLKGDWVGGIVGALLFAGYRFWIGQRNKLDKPKVEIQKVFPHDRIGDITVIAALSGLVGAKVFALIEDLPTFFNDPLGTFFSGSGLAIYGGLIGGFLGVFWYLKKKNIPALPVMDAVAPALIIAYGIGRMGCHFSGDGDWGIVAAAQPEWWFLPDWLWSFDYPRNVLQEGIPIEGCEGIYCNRLAEAVYPSSIYEIIMAFGIGGILWALRERVNIAGVLFFIYLIFNGIERFWIEKIRVNPRYEHFGIEYTQAELIAVLFMLIGIAGCLFLYRRSKKKKTEST